MPLLLRHSRRQGRLPWHRLWTARGTPVDADGGGFLAERTQSEFWSRNTHLRTLDELDEIPCVLALGDPGLGKSWEVGEYATRINERIQSARVAASANVDPDLLLAFDATEFESVETFRRIVFGDALTSWRTGSGLLYLIIDSLDEARDLDTISHALLDELLTIPVARIRLRIACRTAVVPSHLRDGLRRHFDGSTASPEQLPGAGAQTATADVRTDVDEEPLDSFDAEEVVPKKDDSKKAPLFERYSEIEIAPLTRADARAAALVHLASPDEAEQFLAAVSNADAESFAARPQGLFALMARFRAGDSLAASQEELFRALCLTLADPSPVQPHGISAPPLTSRAERYQLACRISAVMLLSNRPTLWLAVPPVVGPNTLEVASMTGTEHVDGAPFRVRESELWEAVNTALFTASTEQSGIAAHLTFAEFLTADWLTRGGQPLPQIMALLTDPNDPDRRIVPQLRQVAAWLAAMRQDVFDVVALAEPDIMLWSDVVQLPVGRRPGLVDALLQGTTQNRILNPPFGMRGRLAKLSHSSLAQQLAPVFTNRGLPERTRELALDIAWSTHLAPLSAAATKLALDESESVDFRAQAARFVADVGSEDERQELVLLATTPPASDVADELKGSALRACWKLLKPSELFEILAHPKRPNFGGAYSLALREIGDALTDLYGVAGAQWLAADPQSNGTSLDHVIDATLRVALKGSQNPTILSALADYAIKRFQRHEDLIYTSHRLKAEEDGLKGDIESDVELRRRWVEAIIERNPVNIRDLFSLTHHSPRLFGPSDVGWGLHELTSLPHGDPRRKAWAELVRWSFDYQPVNVAAVFEHRSDPDVAGVFPNLTTPYSSVEEALADVASQQATFVREQEETQKRHAAAERKRKSEQRPPALGSLPTRLTKRIANVADPKVRWMDAVQEILRINPKQFALSFDPGRLKELRALRGRPESEMIVAAAACYLSEATVPEEPFPNGGTRWEVIFGFAAAVAILELSPDGLDEISPDIWSKWMRALVGHFADDTEEPLQITMLNRAAIVAPDVARSELIRLLDAQARERQGWFRDSMFEVALQVPGVEEEIARRIQTGEYGAAASENILGQLLKRESVYGQCAALELFRISRVGGHSDRNQEYEESKQRGLAAGAALFFKNPSVVWMELWSYLTSSDDAAREFFQFAVRNRDFIAKAALDSLTDERLADLYLLISRLYPPEADPWHVGVFSPGFRDNIQHLRSSLLQSLEGRKSETSVAALERIARTEPVRDHLVQLWLTARAAFHGEQWSGIEPREIIDLAERAELRIVESSAQLLDVIGESLVRLQDELQGEWRSVEGLWNVNRSGNEPKSEDHLSNEIARHLKRDLADRRVVVGRELRIQIPVPGGAGGLRTDIDVQAPPVSGRRQPGEIPRVVVEVKGSWNPEVKSAMGEQLVDKYLDPQKIRGGLFVVGYFTCGSWKRSKPYRQSLRCGTLNQLEIELRGQATELTNGVRDVRPRIIDVSLPDGTPGESRTRTKSTTSKASRPTGKTRLVSPAHSVKKSNASRRARSKSANAGAQGRSTGSRLAKANEAGRQNPTTKPKTKSRSTRSSRRGSGA